MSKVNFIEELTKQLKDKKHLSDSSIQAYLRNIRKLNNDSIVKDFNFLKDTDAIQKKLEGYKENTKRNYLISIVSVLSLATKPAIKKLHDKYYDLMMKKNEQIYKEVNPNDLTETQEKNWMNWNAIKEKYALLEKDVDVFVSDKSISEHQYNTLLSYVILSLYVKQSPRRNKDYQIMLLTSNYTPDLSKDKNYIDMTKKEFIFNSYKTSSKYGTQRIPINDDLWISLEKYFKFHPNITYTKKTGYKLNVENSYFLMYPNKTPLDKVNSITRILNKIFDKAIGSSMLRHIFLTDKYGDTLAKQTKDANDMGHSKQMQSDYIKIPKNIVVSL